SPRSACPSGSPSPDFLRTCAPVACNIWFGGASSEEGGSVAAGGAGHVGEALEVVVAVLDLAERKVLGADPTGIDRRHVVLEAVVGHRVGDAGGALLGRYLRDVVQCGLVAGDVPNLRVDRAGHDQLHVDTAAREVDVQTLGESAHGVLRGVVS